MVSKSKTNKKSRVKVGKLKLNKETIKDLTENEAKKVKGGVLAHHVTIPEQCYTSGYCDKKDGECKRAGTK